MRLRKKKMEKTFFFLLFRFFIAQTRFVRRRLQENKRDRSISKRLRARLPFRSHKKKKNTLISKTFLITFTTYVYYGENVSEYFIYNVFSR